MNVTLRPRSLDIGGSTYPLQNIARVGIWHYIIEAKKHYKWGVILGVLALLAFGAGEAGLAIGLVLAVCSGGLLWRSMNADDRHLYSLRLETSGNPTDAIFSDDLSEVRKLRNRIIDHMEQPHAEPTTINLGNTFVKGDQINVEGYSNTGKAVS